MQAYSSDIIIVGGGMVGLTLACALAQQTNLSILILEAQESSPSWSETHSHHRVSAIALSSQRLFQNLHVWKDIKQKRVSPFNAIHVWDAVKQSTIQFNSHDIAETVLGYIIENDLIHSVLQEKIKQYTHIQFISPVSLTALQESADQVDILAADGRTFSAKCVIGADGARSWLRDKAGITLHKKEYAQLAIVANVRTEHSHQQTARQVFLPTGPLAFLPLQSTQDSSIVWSAQKEEAERLMSLNEADFNQALTKAFAARLGEVQLTGQRYAFPLQKQQATHYIQSRLALVGDAAQTVHPLAGQGVNMGLLDAASLAEVIADAVNERRDFSSYHTLRRYERWRKADNQALLKGVDAIHYLFESDQASVQTLRSVGMAMVHQMRFLRNIFSRHAVGNRLGLPKMATS